MPCAWRSAASCSRVIVTTTVAEAPPAVGRSFAGMASRSWQKASPWRTEGGRAWSMPFSGPLTAGAPPSAPLAASAPTSAPTASDSARGPVSGPLVRRVGEAMARRNFCRMWPCSSGMRNRPWQVPSSSSRIVNIVRRRCCGFLVGECFALELLGHLGGDDLEDLAAQDRQLLGVVVRCQGDQVSLSLRAVRIGDGELTGIRQPAQSMGDRSGLREVHLAVAHRLRELVVPLDGASQLQVRAHCSAYLLGLHGEPVSGATRGFGVGGTGTRQPRPAP